MYHSNIIPEPLAAKAFERILSQNPLAGGGGVRSFAGFSAFAMRSKKCIGNFSGYHSRYCVAHASKSVKPVIMVGGKCAACLYVVMRKNVL